MAFLRAGLVFVMLALLFGCSGGGSSGGGDPTASIGLANAEDITGAVVRTAFASSEGGLLGALPGGPAPAGAGAGRGAGPAFATRDPFGPDTDECAEDGEKTTSGDLADPETFTVGDSVNTDFDLCDDGEVVLDGGLDFVISDLVGDLLEDEFSVVFALVMRLLSVDDGSDLLILDGDGDLSIDTTGLPVTTVSLAGDSLEITDGAETALLRSYSTTLVFDDDTDTYSLSASGMMEHSDFSGSVRYSTETELEGEGDDDPTSGLFTIFGAFDALIDVIPLENGTDVDLEIDLDGNGTPEGLVETTWSALMD